MTRINDDVVRSPQQGTAAARVEEGYVLEDKSSGSRTLVCSTHDYGALYRIAYPDGRLPGGEARFAAWLYASLGHHPLVGDQIPLVDHDDMLAAAEKVSPEEMQEATKALMMTSERNAQRRAAAHQEAKALTRSPSRDAMPAPSNKAGSQLRKLAARHGPRTHETKPRAPFAASTTPSAAATAPSTAVAAPSTAAAALGTAAAPASTAAAPTGADTAAGAGTSARVATPEARREPPKTEMQALVRLRELASAQGWGDGEMTALLKFASLHNVPYLDLATVAMNAPAPGPAALEAAKSYAIAYDAVKNGLLPAERALDFKEHFLPALREGRLTCELADPSVDKTMAGSQAYYLPDKNILRLCEPGLKLDSFLDCSVLIHEAQHVVQDGKKLEMTLLDNERDAYSAGAEYMLRVSKAIVDTPDGPRLDSSRMNLVRGNPELQHNPVTQERIWTLFWQAAEKNVARGRFALNGQTLYDCRTKADLADAQAQTDTYMTWDGTRPFDRLFPTLLLSAKRAAGMTLSDGTPYSLDDVRTQINKPYKKDGVDTSVPPRTPAAAPKAAEAVAASATASPPPSLASLPPLTCNTVRINGFDIPIEYDPAATTPRDLALVEQALVRYPEAWLRAAATRGGGRGKALPTVTLTDSPRFAAMHDRGAVDAGWYDTKHNRLVINLEQLHGKSTYLKNAAGNRLSSDEWLQHTVVHEFAHYLDAVGGDHDRDGGELMATRQGQKQHAGAFVTAVQRRNESEDRADYASAYDRIMNMGVDDSFAQEQEAFAEIVNVLVTEGEAGRARLRSRPSLAPLVDAVEAYMKGGMKSGLLTPKNGAK